MFPAWTPYGYCLLVICAVSALMFAASMRVYKLRAWPVLAALCVLLGAAGARGYYILTQNLLCGYPMFDVVSFYPYEHAMCGAVIGVIAALWLGAKITRQSAGRVLDAAALVGLILIAFARMTESLSDFGWGAVVEQAMWQRMPFAVLDMYGQWHWAVFFLEAALALAAYIWTARCDCMREGQRFSIALLWWSAGQVFCESFRVETIRWGFVRVQQVQCAVLALALLLVWSRMHGMKRAALARRLGAFALCIGAVAFVEFALDKLDAIPNAVLYALMAAALGVMGSLVQKIVLDKAR